MTKIYAIANQKGGVGKTTTTVNLAAYLAVAKQRVLVVDMDPQSNATSGFGFDKLGQNYSAYDLVMEEVTAMSTVVRYKKTGVHLIPSSPELSGAEVELVNGMAREFRLKAGLLPVQDQFDYILIDCPPSLGLLTLNALTAAKDGILIPVQCEYLALEGLSQLVKTVQLVKRHLNQNLDIAGLVMTMYDGRTNLSRQVVEEVREHFGPKVFRTIIPRNIRISEAPSFGMPISEYAPNSPGAMGYKILALELIKRNKAEQAATAQAVTPAM